MLKMYSKQLQIFDKFAPYFYINMNKVNKYNAQRKICSLIKITYQKFLYNYINISLLNFVKIKSDFLKKKKINK
jgi:hypothetical protein